MTSESSKTRDSEARAKLAEKLREVLSAEFDHDIKQVVVKDVRLKLKGKMPDPAIKMTYSIDIELQTQAHFRYFVGDQEVIPKSRQGSAQPDQP